jgi:bifunctional DNA-binding transcriptional regulator/antitoxin component of YhaV-PrlF toxin-antitoxin module
MLAKKSSKNQITLPKAIVASFKDVDYFEVTTQNGRIILEPLRTKKGSEVRSRLENLGIRETDVDAAIAYARGKSR